MLPIFTEWFIKHKFRLKFFNKMNNINAITPKHGYPYLKGTLIRHPASKSGERDVYIVGGGPVNYLVKFPSEWERPFRVVNGLDLETSPATLSDLIQIKLLNLISRLKTLNE